jgi:uncharacterized protein YqhQ
MKKRENINPRNNSVGGQAVIEGVMMKCGDNYSVAIRKEDGSIAVKNDQFIPLKRKFKILGIPLLRGVVNFVEMMALSYKTLATSADAMGLSDDVGGEASKFEKWLDKHIGKNLINILMVISTILGFALGFGLFFFLPIWITKSIDSLSGGNIGWFKNLIEGCIKIVIFVAYLWGVSFMKDIRRTFEYHGAEHKSIFCYESGDEVTVANVRKQKRFHPRCGTSFMFVMLLLSILIFSLPFVTWDNMVMRMLTKLILLPVIVGVGYEFIMFAGKHDNILVKILSAPGLWMQRITTREPDDSQIEIAITALKSAMPHVFPDFTVDNTTAAPKTDIIGGTDKPVADGSV